MSKNALSGLAVVLIFALLGGQTTFAADDREKTPEVDEGDTEMKIMSSAFNEGEPIPRVYTCDGKDLSPPLSWEEAPDGTRSLVLIGDDPDAPMGTWVHWVLYNIPPDTTALAQGMPTDTALEDGSKQGVTDFGRPGYGGPCPPKGKPHRYFFKLYALDTLLEFEGKVKKEDVEKAMKDHILAEAQIMGTYQRK